MDTKELRTKARELTREYKPNTPAWNQGMSDLASDYFQSVGFSIEAAMQMDQVAEQMCDEWKACNIISYLEGNVKL